MTPCWEDFDEPRPKACGECGLRGNHHSNCPLGSGDTEPNDREELQEEPSPV